MNRRTLLIASAATAGVLVGGVAIRRATMAPFSLATTIDELNALKAKNLKSAGAWNPYQVFSHIAQSIEYSMKGYPASKSPLFQSTAGSIAFSTFSAVGAMTHDLAEPIPGAPPLAAEGLVNAAIDRAIAALQLFRIHTGALRPHFAYGALTREQYTAAHIMHIRNHMREISA
jgi:hypothetical protein